MKCRAKLDAGIKAMNSEVQKFREGRQYQRLVDCSGDCALSESRYAQDWEKIRKFDARKTRRVFGRHAFNTDASMADMLHELSVMCA
jgi:hypothetical protein